MRLLLLCLAVLGMANAIRVPIKESSCDELDCKAGRECVMADGEPQCLCVISCPDHFKPICGSDGKSYENHCQLHQHACLSGNHIRINHKGFCKKNKNKKYFDKELVRDRQHSLLSKKDLKEELQNDLVATLRKDENKKVHGKYRPAACFAPQRNAIRFLLVDHWQESLKDQPWHVEGMVYRESLWGRFFTCDENKDNYLTPEELLKCAKDVAFFARPGQDNELTKELCIDAMVDDGDKNRDWRLDFEEFTTIMDPMYHPNDKKCSLEGRNYTDGEEIHLICNHCVCAVGNWVCASQECDEKKKKNEIFDGSPVDDFDNAIGEHLFDPLPPVPHTWMEKNRKDKIKGKKLKNSKKTEKFLDFDTDIETIEELNDKQEIELGLEDYYDDLYEQTKSKKKHVLEDALKEVQLLKKKTKHLKKVIKAAKHLEWKKSSNKNHHPKHHQNTDEEKEILENYKKVNFQSGHKKIEESKDPFFYSLDKYEGDLFEGNSWNDLIASNDKE